MKKSQLCRTHKKLMLWLIAALAIGLVVNAWATDRYVNPDGSCGGSTPCYTTVQAAINASINWDVIHVQPGTYYGSLLVNKSLTVRSTGGAATTILDGNHVSENYYMVTLDADDIVFDGFTITNPIYNGTADASGILVGSTPTPHSNIRITNCVIHDIGLMTRAAAYGSYGINSGPVNGLEIDHNTVYNIGQMDPGGASIGILTWGNSATETAQNINIHHNTIYNIHGPTYYVIGIAIGYESKSAVVNANYVHHTDDIGMSSSPSVENAVSFTGNTIDYVGRGFWIRSPWGDTISGNTVDHSTKGLEVYSTVTTPPTVFNCSLAGNTLALDNQSATTLNASGNWWGSAAPVWASILSGTVDYTPWCGLVGTYTNPGYTANMSNLWVDDSSPQTGSLNYVQEGVNMVTGSTINLAPGIYIGQVTVNAFPGALNIVGTGATRADVVIRGVASMTPFNGDRRAVLAIVGTTTVNVSKLTIDGDGQGNSNYRMMGVAFWNSGGSLTDVRVTKVRENPLSGNGHGVGVYAYNLGGGPYTINVTDVQVDDYQKNAFALSGNNLTANLLRVTTIGAGPLGSGYPAQNGIQIGYGASGTVNTCTVSGNQYTGPDWAATGILLFLAPNVSVTGNTVANGNQTGIDYANSGGTVTGMTINSPTSGPGVGGAWAEEWSAYGSRVRGQPQPLAEEYVPGSGWERSLDGNQSVTMTGLVITGQGLTGSYGIYGYCNQHQLTMNVSSCQVTNWDYGMKLEKDATGNIVASTTGNYFTNTNNAWDNQSGDTWNANCYSDFASNGGFPTQYNILGGGGNADYNPSSDCSNIDMVMSSDYIGCVTTCAKDTLYLRFDQVGYYAGQVIVQLPTGMVADWTGVEDVTPASPTANLEMAQAEAVGTTIEVNCLWGPDPDRSVDDDKFFAAVPLRGTSSVHATVLQPTITSYNFVNAAGEHTTGFTITPAASVVDCDAPVATLGGGGGGGGCNAYGNAAAFLGAPLTTAMTAVGILGLPCSPLDHAYVTLNGATNYPVSIAGGTWPVAGDYVAVWTAMTEGCNTFVLHAVDTECNDGFSTPVVTVIKDLTPPTVGANPMNQPMCYSDEPTSPQYGASLIAADLNINATVGSGSCIASSGTLQLGYGSNVYPTTPVVLPVTTWPDAGDAAGLWTWMVSVLPPEYSGTATFHIIVQDCAGNPLLPRPTFDVCIDLHRPDNTFSFFDARPTHLGVWLNWTWSDATGATEMEVWRNGEGDYPVYAGNLSMNDDNYEKVHADLLAHGWTKAATQTGAYTSEAFHGGSDIHHGTYWKDDIGVEGTPARSIYRYVTFVRDAVGNWSTVAPSTYTLTANADRSTNYWLGDYAPDGLVHGPDLILLSAYYFEDVGPAPSYLDIGPENHENAYGKGIPDPDQHINFYDLLPFSFNFGVVQPGGFNIQFPDTKPFSGLDEQPVVSVSRGEDVQLSVGDNFKVTVALSGNAEHSVKVVEAELHFDPQVLKFVSATEGAIEVMDGIPFALTRPIEGCENAVGIAAAAMGEIACIAGDFALATIEFQWIGEQTSTTEIELTSIQLADGHGNIIEGTATTLSINGADAIPVEFALYQNYPNPFNPVTQIRFDLADASNVRLVIFNLLGQEVRTLVAANMPAGAHHIAWDGRDDRGLNVGSGLYLYKLQAGNFVNCRKMFLMR